MTNKHLLAILQTPEDLLALTPEDLGLAILEVLPAMKRLFGSLSVSCFTSHLFDTEGSSYNSSNRPQYEEVQVALAEAFQSLETEGLLVKVPWLNAPCYMLTRRGQGLSTPAEVEAFRKGRVLPAELLHPLLVKKALPIFKRGDVDVAVFQAFKTVEIEVRRVANLNGANFADSDVGVTLMRKAFNQETGSLRDTNVIVAEREALMHLFSGAVGYAKNPTSHRDVIIGASEGARLIIFASQLIEIVHQRIP